MGSPDRRGRGRPSFADLLERDGPNSLVILIGAPEGRWAAELTMQAPECQDAAAAMMRALSWTTLAQPEQPAVPLAVGVAVVGSWRFVRGTASSDATYHLMAAAHAAMSQGRRRGADNSFRFIEHMVSASAILADNDMHLGIPGHVFHPGDIHLQATPAHVLDTLRGQRVRATHGPVTYAGGYQPTIEELVTQWSWTFGVGHLREATLWAAWTPVANALAAGVWGGDVSPLAAKSRQGSLRSLGNPGPSPSERLLRAFMNPGGGTAVPQPPPSGRVVAAAAAAAASRRNTWDTHGRPRGFLRPFNPEHLLNAVRAAQDVADQGKMDRTAQNSLRYWYPLDWEQRKAERCSQGFTPPNAVTLRTARCRFDMAATLLRRWWYSTHGPTYRYLGIDASPQRPGLEVLAIVERVIKRSDTHSLQPGQKPPVEVRQLPMSILGHGRQGLAEKVQSTIHQTWLEYGPSVEQVRLANLDVRQVLSDMGHERDIADYDDVVERCLGVRGGAGRRPPQAGHPNAVAQAAAAAAVGAAMKLFPLALTVPGPQHVLDGILEAALAQMDFWPAWQAQAKVVCQWLASEGHREFLRARLPQGAPDTAHQSARLRKRPDRFAKWRWGTLSAVTRDLVGLEWAVKAAVATVGRPEDLASRDTTTARAFLDATMDPRFWLTAASLRRVAQPVKKFSGWVKGCSCHEDILVQGLTVECKWKGCRAPAFAARVAEFEQAIQQLRDCEDIVVDRVTLHQICDTILATSAMKFHFVREEPYLVWRADDPAMAKQFLDSHDEAIARASREGHGGPHRVTLHFCGTTSPLRKDMEAHAAGRGMTAKLRAEIESYRWCMLDDTWVEAAHKDISAISQKKSRAGMAYRLATSRLEQNFEFLDSLPEDTQFFFHTVLFPKWRSIARAPTLGQPRRFKDCTWLGKEAIQMKVYRLGSESQLSWTKALKDILPAAQPRAFAENRPGSRLRAEYLQLLTAARSQGICSLPIVDNQTADRAARADDFRQAVGILDEASKGGSLRFFRITVAHASRKVLARTNYARDLAAAACPIVVQGYSTWAARDSGATWDIYADGQPEAVDALHLAPWAVLRAGLKHWQQAESDTQGCVSVTSATLASDLEWDIRGGHVPALALLETLGNQGWTRPPPGQPLPEEHTLANSPGHLALRDVISDKAYLRCLVCLPDLLSDAFPSLPVGQPVDYYNAVLRAGKAESIPGAFYQRLIRAANPVAGHPPLQPGEERGRDGAEDNGAVPELAPDPVDAILGDFGEVDRPVPRPRPSRKTQKKKKKDILGDDTLWQPLAWAEPAQADPPQLAALPPNVIMPGHPGSSSDILVAVAQPAPPPAIPEHAEALEVVAAPQPQSQSKGRKRARGSVAANADAAVPQRQRAGQRDIVAHYKGVHILKEVWQEPGRTYTRVIPMRNNGWL